MYSVTNRNGTGSELPSDQTEEMVAVMSRIKISKRTKQHNKIIKEQNKKQKEKKNLVPMHSIWVLRNERCTGYEIVIKSCKNVV